MAEKDRDIKSEHTRDMTLEERKELREKVNGMSQEILKDYRNGFDPDSMGFFGEESV